MIQYMEDFNSTTLITAISTLPQPTLTSLTAALSTTFRHHSHRITTLLSSRIHFSSTLHRLYSLSLKQKSILIAKYLLSILQLVVPFVAASTPLPRGGTSIRLRDLDAVLVLLLFCELRQHDPKALDTTSSLDWHRVLVEYYCVNVLSLSGVKVSPNEELRSLIDVVAKCRRFAGPDTGCEPSGGREVAASPIAVVAMPSVEVKAGGAGECVICKEEMNEGRDVCELPCRHLFHWMCALRWLKKRNTCPCCRHKLPTNDVYEEIQRLWEVVVRTSHTHVDVDAST